MRITGSDVRKRGSRNVSKTFNIRLISSAGNKVI